MFKFRKKNVVSVIQFTGIIAPNMGRKKGLNIQDFDKSIDQAFQNKNVKAVALQINSPGGSPVQSDFLAKRIIKLSREKNIPVISFVEDVAASGGYWLACAADEIFASRASIVGSIGVISAGFGFDKAMIKLGIDRRIYTAGESKSILDPFSPEKKEDVKKLKSVQKELHEYFIEYIKTRRGGKLKEDNQKIFSGLFWSGETAMDLGLIDGIGEIKEILKNRFGDKVKIKEYAPKRKFFDFGNFISIAFDNIIDKVEEKVKMQKFGL
tara:strand:- start:256 stop:1056 length:801 start_codon:yes stop_codon:yes gene_type:complete